MPKGSKVISSPITFVSTNAVILYEDFVPVFADIDPDYLSLDPDAVLKQVTKDTAAVIWIHHSGMVHPFFLETVKELNKMGIPVIEDCAHGAGAFYSDGTRVGSKNISCFSYQAVKNMPSFDGGSITVQTQKDYDRVKRLAWLGISQNTYDRTTKKSAENYKWLYDVPELGWKYNGNEMSAIMALTALKYLDRDNAYRKQIYEWYNKGLNLISQDDTSSHHLVVAKIKNRDRVVAELKANDISPGVHYLPNFEFTPFQKYYDGTCPNAESITKQIISLPNHLYLTKADVERVINII